MDATQTPVRVGGLTLKFKNVEVDQFVSRSRDTRV